MIETNTHNIYVSIAALKAKDKTAFADLYDKYSGALLNIILRIVNNQELAEDVLQESLLKIWRNTDKYDENKSTIFTWMLNICRNTAIDALRKKGSRPTIQSDIENVYVSSAHTIETNVNLIGVKDSLKYLTTEQSLAIQAVYFNGLTHEDAAQFLNLPLGTVKTRIRMGLVTLKKVFAK